MKTKAKTFDCVAMKRAGAARVYRKTRKMSFRQQVEFWRQQSELLRREQETARSRHRKQAAAKGR